MNVTTNTITTLEITGMTVPIRRRLRTSRLVALSVTGLALVSTGWISTASASSPPGADASRQALISGVLDAHHAAGEFVGARIAFRDADGTITEAAVGTQTSDPTGAPVDLDVPWNVGSVTKTIVAVVVLQLAEEGVIDLDAGIDRFVPELAGADRITPRQLLQHTSGLAEYLDQAAVLNDPQREWSPAEIIAVAEAAGRRGEPGGPYSYSNTNYIVLGELIERATGNRWEQEVHTRIVEPLGMSATGMITDELPAGFQVVDGQFVDTTHAGHPSLGGASGGLQSTGRDLLRFAAALADGTLLSADSWAAMREFAPGEDYSQFGIIHGYGLGIEQYATSEVTAIGHMGTGEAQSAFLGIDLQHGTAVAVTTNTAFPGPQAIMALETLAGA